MSSTQEWRPCYICGEKVLWQTNGIGWHPIQYHDCKPVPRARLEQAERERDELRESRDGWRKAAENQNRLYSREVVRRIEETARAEQAERERDEARKEIAIGEQEAARYIGDRAKGLVVADLVRECVQEATTNLVDERDEARTAMDRSSNELIRVRLAYEHAHAGREQARVQLEQAVALLTYVNNAIRLADWPDLEDRLRSFLAGQPAPAKPVVDDAMGYMIDTPTDEQMRSVGEGIMRQLRLRIEQAKRNKQ